MTTSQRKFMQLAIDLSKEGMNAGKGGPFGCVIVKDGVVVGKGCNSVISDNDPTAHAEIVAIKDACKNLGSFQLGMAVKYTLPVNPVPCVWEQFTGLDRIGYFMVTTKRMLLKWALTMILFIRNWRFL
jgi:tRNA(Arg) A34 adenosine deaminase TadA